MTFAKAPSLAELPDVIDVRTVTPPNPPEETQMKFVGLSYESAYAEAETFVKVVDEFSVKHGPGALASLRRIIDFGSGWGRISRTLLTKVEPHQLHALDVDNQMTALINLSLPGLNALTIDPEPPTVLGDESVNGLLAFSVFSHLSGGAHEAWAAEIGRLVAPGGFAAITVLDQAFFGQVAGAQAAVKAGTADDFATSLATTFDDVAAAQRNYDAGEIQYAGIGGGEVRTGDYYGWTAAPPKYIERVWGAAGFRVVEWIPSGTLFPQALVFMVRTDQRPAFGHISVRTRAVAPTANRVARGLARRGKRLLRGSR
jgi:hypothetical protein